MASQADFWQGPSANVPVVNTAGQIFEEVQVAILNQVLFTLVSFQYTPNTHSIFVWKNGLMLRRGVDYTETSATQVTIATASAAGDKFWFVAIAINQLTPPIVFNGQPPAGTVGQILTKNSSNDYDSSWASPSSITTLLDAPRQNIASAATVNLAAIASQTRNVQITGNIQITGFQIANGQVWILKFAAALVLKNNASIVTNTGNDINVVANASCILRATADNVVEILSYSAYAADAVVTSLNGGQLAGQRNKIINGNFNINQRLVSGAVVLAAGAYGHDRWKAGAAGCSYTFATSGDHTTINISAGSLIQVIEDINVNTGTYVLSNQGTAQARIGVNGAAATGAYAACPLVSAAATGRQTISVEFSTGTVDRVQLELGLIATPFETRLYGFELNLCKRYLPAYVAYGTGTEDICWGATTTTSQALIGFQHDVETRVPPTGVALVGAIGNFQLTSMSVSSAVTAITFSAASRRITRLSVTGTGTPYAAPGAPVILYGGAAGTALLLTGCEL